MIERIDKFVGENHWLSNFSEEGLKPSVEHYYQATKAFKVDDAMFVMLAKTPGNAKRRGRRIPIREGWDEMKLDVMLKLLRVKFKIEPLRTKLLDTQGKMLVEGNTWGDTYWGVCNGIGKNHLGNLLMQVREELRSA